MLKADLKVVGGKHDGTVIPLTSKKFLIGREQDCQLRPNSELVSRHHCAITLDDYTVRVRDFGSTNGTFVNGDRVQSQAVLYSGDRIEIGALEFEVLIHKEAQVAAAEPVEPEAAAPPQEVADLGTPPPANTDTAFEMSLPQEVQAGVETTIFSTEPTATVPQQTVAAPIPAVPESFDAAAAGQDSAANIPIKLPPPESTGAAPKVEPSEKPAAAPGTDEEGNPSTHAADIIRQYRQRRS